MPAVARTILLLVLSNVFMTFAWYAHLRNLKDQSWFIAAVASWGIALFEYLLQVPANRIGHAQLQLGQLKILQEVITLGVFVPFAVFYMREPVRDELPLGGALPDGGGVLHVPAVSKQALPGARLAHVWGKPYSPAVAS